MAIPSIALIPSGYKASKLYSVLPTNGAGDLDFSRATGGAGTTGNATRVNQNGLLESVLPNVPRLDYSEGGCPSLLLEPQSTNLITYPRSFGNSYWTKSGASIEGDASTAGVEKVVNGDFATDTDWSKGTGWSISAGVGSFNTTTNGSLTQSGFLINKLYVVNVSVTSYVRGEPFIAIGQGSSYTIPTTIGTHTIYVNSGSVDTLLRIYSGQSGVGGEGSIDNVSVKEVQGFASPHVDYPTGAFKLVEDTSTGNHWIRGSSFSVTSTKSGFSIRVKPNGRTKVALRESSGTGKYAVFNLTTATVIEQTGTDAKITTLADGWFEISFSDVLTTLTIFGFILLNDSYVNGSPLTHTYTGDGTSGVYIFGAQLEQQSYATSLILGATEGSTVTRIQDTASKSGISSLINSTEGVLYAEMSVLANDLTRRIITITDGTLNNIIKIEYKNISNQIEAVLFRNGTSTECLILHTLSDTTEINKIAFKYKQNDFSLFVNGIKVGADTSGAVFTPSTLNNLRFSQGGSNAFYGKLKNLQVYNTALTDLELEKLTSYTSFSQMATALNYEII